MMVVMRRQMMTMDSLLVMMWIMIWRRVGRVEGVGRYNDDIESQFLNVTWKFQHVLY